MPLPIAVPTLNLFFLERHFRVFGGRSACFFLPYFTQEVFVRRSYLQHGVVAGDSAVVVDAGANIGLFSLHCLREAKEVQVSIEGVLIDRGYEGAAWSSGMALSEGFIGRSSVLFQLLAIDSGARRACYA